MRRSLAPSFRPQLESLEDRSLPSCTVSATAGVLTIVGDAAPDQVRIYDSGGGTVWGFATGKGEFGYTGIKDIVIDTGAGDDHVEYYLVGDLLAHFTRTVNVDLRDGNDFFSANLKNPFTNQPSNFQVGSLMLMKVVGEAGNDTLLFNASNVTMHQATMKIAYYGGDGDDFISMSYSGLIDHGGVSFFAFGEAGRDTIGEFFNANPASVAPAPGGIRGIIDGGADDDLIVYSLKAPAAVSTVTCSVDGGDGNDTLFTNFTNLPISNVEHIF